MLNFLVSHFEAYKLGAVSAKPL